MDGVPGGNAAALHAALASLEAARTAAAEGDVSGMLHALRAVPDGLPLGDEATFLEITGMIRDAATRMGFDELAASAEAVLQAPDDPHLLYTYGYGCVERGVAFLAVPALSLALARAPEAAAVRMELVSALEAESRNAEAVSVLSHEATLQRWIGRYLLVFNCLMAGDLDGARQWFTRLGKPEEPAHDAMATRLTRMLARAQAVTGTDRLDAGHRMDADPLAPLGSQDLRGWHFVLNGGVLTTLSPYGFHEGMSGRYAFYNESLAGCRYGLDRLAVALDAGRRVPGAVALLPDRSSRILGLAAAQRLELPTREWTPDQQDVLVIAFTLSGLDPALLGGLRTAGGQLLVEHATCWTDPPPVVPDVTTLLHQVVSAPWEARRRPLPGGGGWEDLPADDRPEAELAAAVLAADPADWTAAAQGAGGAASSDPGTDDSDGVLADFVARVAGRWVPDKGPRDRVWSPGPVHSSRFW